MPQTTTRPPYLINVDKLYYKAILPRFKNEFGKWQYLGALSSLFDETQPPIIHIGNSIQLISNWNKAESKKHEFRYKYDIFFSTSKIGILHYHPDNNSFLADSGIVGIQINNFAFYQEFFIRALKDLHFHSGLRFKHFTNLDIAVDTAENVIEKFDQYYEDPKVYITKKVNISRQKQTYPLTRCSHFTIYNKQLEMATNNYSKRYISEHFLGNGFKYKEDIFRCELRLDRKVLDDTYFIDLFKLNEPEYLSEVFEYFQKKYMRFREIKGKNMSRYPDLPLIEMHTSGLFQKVSKSKKKYSSEVSKHSLKMAIKEFYWLIENSEDPKLKFRLYEIIVYSRLYDWFILKRPYFKRHDLQNENIKEKTGLPF